MVLDSVPEPKTSFKRITPLSADLAAHGRTRTLALQKLHRICQAEIRTLKARYTKILGHKLLGPNASLSVGQSYKDFYIR